MAADFIKVRVSSEEYSRTMGLYARARKKTHEEVVTRAAAQANFHCVKSENSGGVKRASLGKFPLNATADPQKGGATYKGRFFFAHQASFGVKKGADGEIIMRPAALKAYNRRRSARGAIAAGFLASARKLGLKKKGAASVQPKAGGSASKSTGDRARGRLKASSVNMVAGSYEVGRPAMDRAIAATIKDMRDFAHKLLEKAGEKFTR